MCYSVCVYVQLVSDNEELLHQIEELQQQKQAVLEASQHTNLQFSTAQGEVRASAGGGAC